MEGVESTHLTQTVLIHRSLVAEPFWWRMAVVYEYPGFLDAAGLRALVPYFDHVAALGADAIMLRPALLDLSTPEGGGVLSEVLAGAHQRNLKVIVRLAGSVGDDPTFAEAFHGFEGPAGQVLVRARAALALGVDGIDLGMFAEVSPTMGRADLSQFEQLVRKIEAAALEMEREVPISMEATHRSPALLEHHVSESWVHTMRDDRLYDAPFAAAQIVDRIADSYAERRPLGMSSQWRVSPEYRSFTAPDSRSSWYATATNHHRRTAAMMALAACLPGAFIMRQGDEIGMPEKLRTEALPMAAQIQHLVSTKERLDTQQVTWNTDAGQVITGALPVIDVGPASPLAYGASYYEHVRSLLAARRELGLYGAHVAKVAAPELGQEAVYLLVGRSGVIVNTSSHALDLPPYLRPYLVSDRKLDPAQLRQVPPEATVWCHLEAPQLSAHYDAELSF